MVTPLEKRFLSDQDASRLYAKHKDLKASPEEYCPTCQKKGFYLWPDKATKNQCDCKIQLQLHKHYLNAGIGALYQRLTWDDYSFPDVDTKQEIELWMNNSRQMISHGVGLILMGDIGTGKTLLATLILKEILKAGYTVYSVTFAGMVDMFTSGWNSKEDKQFFVDRIRNSDVLLLDDLGKEFKSSSKLSESTFDSVLRARVQEGRPTFITTNLDLVDMEDGYGAAIFSLLVETSMSIQITGEDYRPTAGRNKIQEIIDGLVRPIV